MRFCAYKDVIQIYGQPAIKTNEKTDKAIGHDYKRENLEMMRMIIEAVRHFLSIQMRRSIDRSTAFFIF